MALQTKDGLLQPTFAMILGMHDANVLELALDSLRNTPLSYDELMSEITGDSASARELDDILRGKDAAREDHHRVSPVAKVVLHRGLAPPLPPSFISASVLGYAMRRGLLDPNFVRNPETHQKAKAKALALARDFEERRRAFVATFLFGCKRASGSTHAWKIGSAYIHAGLRKDIALWANILVCPTELRNVRSYAYASTSSVVGAWTVERLPAI